jgi:plastocyanin
VKKISFEVRLSPPVVSTSVDGIHIIDMPGVTEEVKNGFNPDNIIIKKGETVRWINSDEIEHIFSSTFFIGKGGISSPSIKPGEGWEYKFENTGEYFYICFIHRSMIGAITVEK